MSVVLYLVRHAEAAVAEEGQPDGARALLPRGRRAARELARALRRAGIRFDLLVHSPLLRAVQTAEPLVDLLDGSTRVEPRLAESPGQDLLPTLEGESIALVGHQPFLGELAALLLWGFKLIENADDPGPFRIEQASVALLVGELRPAGMRLVGLYSPSALRAFRPRDPS